ncbi:MAG TPA: NAD(P)/FAD-dependent oxidoreductase [Actinoplanes sp.]|nr:NAD(P)/FAD-dependent oxidoreductase [Actinoplanes sp.]
MYDFAVVGGRVAGAATAIHLARRGYRVALIDRERQPRPTLSTHVFGDWEAFAPLGVLDDPRMHSAPPMSRFRTDIEGCVVEAGMVATPYARALRREVLDPLLRERAAAFDGVDLLDGRRVGGLLWERDRVTGVRLESGHGETRLAARVVVGADGRNSLVARQAGAAAYLRRPKVRAAYYAYFAGLAAAPLPALEYYWSGSDVVIVAPCDAGLHCVCVLPRMGDLPRWRGQHTEMFGKRLDEIPTLAPRLAGAKRAGPVRGSTNLGSYLRTPYGPGWALVGDAGANVHPCIGAGIDHAVTTAGLFGAAADRALSGAGSWDAEMAEFQAARDARIRPTLEAAIRLAGRPPIPPHTGPWLGLMLGMPGFGHDLGTKAVDVMRLLVGDEQMRRLESMMPPAMGDRS